MLRGAISPLRVQIWVMAVMLLALSAVGQAGLIGTPRDTCSILDVEDVVHDLFEPETAETSAHLIASELMRCNSDGLKNAIFWKHKGRKQLKSLRDQLTLGEQVVVDVSLATVQPPFKRFIHDNGFTDHLRKNTAIVDEIYSRPGVRRAIDRLSTLDPELLVQYLPFFKRVGWVRVACCGQGPGNTSYASQGLNFMLEDIRDVRLARRSVAIKLLIQEGLYELPEQTGYHRDFDPGGWVVVKFRQLRWSDDDVAHLEALQSSPYEFYRLAASEALAAIRDGRLIVGTP